MSIHKVYRGTETGFLFMRGKLCKSSLPETRFLRFIVTRIMYNCDQKKINTTYSSIPHSPFPILHSHSPFPIPHYPFPIPHYPFHQGVFYDTTTRD
ncbi:MAG: hypothetical protein ACRCT1_15215 [Microcoleaceae cyanobacterium]